MKKLMIAAAVAAMTVGAFADNQCGGLDNGPSYKAQVYKFTFSGKTTKGVNGTSSSQNCDGIQGAGCYMRAPAKLKIKGWVVYCEDPTCMTLLGGTADASYSCFWTLKPFKGTFNDGATVAFDLINVIGKKPNKAEAAGKLSGTVNFNAGVAWDIGELTFAGLGKYKKGVYSSISGNFAGSPAASWYINVKSNAQVCEQTDVYDCATLAQLCDAHPNTVAFGKWSVKYSKSASKKVAKQTGKLPKAPSYATVISAE